MFGLRYLKNVSTLTLDQNKCNGCRMCEIVCPHQVFAFQNKKAMINDLDACMECGACQQNCPEGAIFVRSGVGCAAAILSGVLKGSEPTCECGCSDKQKSVSCC